MDFKQNSLPPNPISRANPISKLLFLWTFPLFWKGFRNELKEDDLYDILKEDETEHIGNKLEKYWIMELENAKRTGRKPSLMRAVVKITWKTLLFACTVYLVDQCGIMVAQPIFLRLLILTFNDPNAESWEGYAYAGAISLLAFLHTLVIHPGVYQILHLGMKVRVMLSTLLYRKSLRLSKAAQNQTNTGQIVNLLSNDCTRFDNNMNFLPFVVSAPLQVALLTYLLYQQIGPASFVGVGVIILLLPMQYYLGKFSAVCRSQIAKRTDERGRIMSEIIIGMRVIKQYAWEKPFSLLIDGIRKLEVIELRKRGILLGLHHAIFTFAPKLVQYLALLTFVLVGNEPMSADKVFFTITCLQVIIKTTVQFTPQAAAGIGEMLVAVKRIQNFLLLEDQVTNNNLQLQPYKASDITKDGPTLATAGVKSNSNVTSTPRRVSLQNVCASWTDNGKPTVDNVTFTVEGDMVVMVVGPVGSSKTSLLHTIIDELPITSGSINVGGTVSYASQEPWIFAGNLRQNILFGLPYEEFHYKQTLKACALEEDLKQLPYGDMTVVGERGIALSGGQKARVNLARAIYRKSDIYLLDDPLSAVDTRVSRHLFENCVKVHLQGSVRILVTHQLQYLPQADYVIVLNHGKVLAQGTFEELVDAGIDFVGLIQSGESEDQGPMRKKKKSTVEQGDVADGKSNDVDQGKPEVNVEKQSGGSVTARTYREYFVAGHSFVGLLFLMVVFPLCTLSMSGNDYWLSLWTNAEVKRSEYLDRNKTACDINPDDDKMCEDTYLGENTYLYVYTGFVVSVVLCNLCRGIWFYTYCAKISVNIHDKMFQSMVRAPMKFFDDNASGRIMNRFTKDVGTMDELLPPAFIDTITIFLQVTGVICVVIISNYYMSVPTVFLFLALYFLRMIFIETARDIKRIESIRKSPVFTHVAATIQGLTTIRACKSQTVLIKQFEGHQDIHSSAWFLFIAANRCFGIWLELISDIFLVLVAFSFFFISSSEEGGNVGLAISSLLALMGTLQWGMRQSAETENFMTSVERALEYSKLKSEADLDSKADLKPPRHWPDKGQIEFKKLYLTYEESKPVLKDLSFEIRPSEKIGIAGRTGAGKSSIIAALFRLTEPEGEIIIDNVAVKQIGLHDLRKNISIIPQDPVLFSGSVRYNLDPFNQFEDPDLWKVIKEVELKDAVPSLDYQVADGGANFSVGQRQLVCLARAILRKNRILVMDEATANVDPGTDHLIQQTIRSKFADCTIITIAHRLHSIIDCDRILVLDHGQLKEYDHPHILLSNEIGIFSEMVAQTGQNTCALLKTLAHEAFMQNREETQENSSNF